jgi:hypothetical protein
MRDAIEWDEADILSLIKNKVQESLTLDYKKSDALRKTDGKKAELSKDVSAFANSAGGVILYGMEEDKHYPTKADGGFDPNDISKEWIEQVEQVVNSTIHPKIDGLRINQIALQQRGAGRVLYAVSIPAATSRAPHQAADKRYYKRYNFQAAPMEDYEIRDIYRRASTPDLYIDFRFDTGITMNIPASRQIILNALIGNRSREPALYAAITVYVDALLTITYGEGLSQGRTIETNDRRKLHIFAKNWGVPSQLPIFSEVQFRITDQPIVLTMDEIALRYSDFYLGYDIRAPGFSTFKIVRVVHQSDTLWIRNEVAVPATLTT